MIFSGLLMSLFTYDGEVPAFSASSACVVCSSTHFTFTSISLLFFNIPLIPHLSSIQFHCQYNLLYHRTVWISSRNCKRIKKAPPKERSSPCQIDSEKNKKILSGIPPCCAAGWNFSRGSAMKLHRCYASESLLVTLVVVKIRITLDCRNQIVTRSKLSEIVHFRFENTPKSLHWTVVNASANA